MSEQMSDQPVIPNHVEACTVEAQNVSQPKVVHKELVSESAQPEVPSLEEKNEEAHHSASEEIKEQAAADEKPVEQAAATETPAKNKTPGKAKSEKKSAAKKEKTPSAKKSAVKETNKSTSKKSKKAAEEGDEQEDEGKEPKRGRGKATKKTEAKAAPQNQRSRSRAEKVNSDEYSKYSDMLNKKTSRTKKAKDYTDN